MTTAACALGLVVLWRALAEILGSSRGLELTDEGLYLLAADPPSLQAAWGFPFGWHTRPLFMALGYDIANFRTAGALILVLAAAWFGWTAVRTLFPARVADTGRRSTWLAVMGAATGSLGSLLYYAPMMRTPSYNWLNLVGILVASSASLVVLRRVRRDGLAHARWLIAAFAALSSLSLFITFPAKPSTLPLLLVLTAALLLLAVGWRTAAWWTAWNVALLPAWLAAAVLLRIWPTDFLSIFRLAVQMPSPDPLQTGASAVRSALLLPRDAVAGLGSVADGPAFLLILAAGLLIAPLVAKRRWFPLRLAGLALAAVAALAVAGVPLPKINPTGNVFALAHAPLTTATLLFLLATLLAAWPTGGATADEEPQRLRWLRRMLAAFTALLAFVFAFGSGNGIYAQAAVASGLILLSAFLVIARKPLTRSALALGAVVMATTLSFAVAGIVGGWRSPYRMESLLVQNTDTVVGAHGARLLLSPAQSGALGQLRSQAEAHGWSSGTPLVDVSYTWNPGVAYFLGAQVPKFLQLTIFGYAAAHDIRTFHLTQPYLDFPFDESWILTTRNAVLDPSAQAAVEVTTDALSGVTGNAFPDAYACVTGGDFALWFPITKPDRAGTACME
ncbi:MAG: hypothetical protein ACYC2Z_06815 [Candidatus Nanopelagicales bacterium]